MYAALNLLLLPGPAVNAGKFPPSQPFDAGEKWGEKKNHMERSLEWGGGGAQNLDVYLLV